MILNWLLLIPLLGGVVAWLVGLRRPMWSRWLSLAALGAYFILVLALWVTNVDRLTVATEQPWLLQFDSAWIPQIGARYHLALDGLSLVLLALTGLLSLLAVATSWQEIQDRVGFFHFNLLWAVAALTGVFLAVDLLLFSFFWEVMLVPLYLLIGIWGHERRIYATLKFVLFTQLGGLLMLVAILGLYFLHGDTTGIYTFDYQSLLGTNVAFPRLAFWLMLGFFAAFAVKLPAFPLHSWLPDAHTEAPTAGSVLLAGLVLKAGAYGFLRFLFPLFPQAAASFAPVAMGLGVIGILYGAVMAFAQTDLKRMVAYTSVSHMGFILLGVFSRHNLAWQGAVVIMVAHGLSTSGLFMLVGDLYQRLGTRDITRMGGLWTLAPRMSRIALMLALASLGLPGLVNFVGEYLVLVGVYKTNSWMAGAAAVGLVIATVYSLWMLQRIFTGENVAGWHIADYGRRELAIMTVVVVLLVGLGLYPQLLLNTTQTALTHLQATTAATESSVGQAQTLVQPYEQLPAAGGDGTAYSLERGK
ncbi:MAG: NADH-quinone oxidoreductase subunit M [Chloroflexota bacterium]|jgi:NADH-quinone oxidoreductase subunit M